MAKSWDNIFLVQQYRHLHRGVMISFVHSLYKSAIAVGDLGDELDEKLVVRGTNDS